MDLKLDKHHTLGEYIHKSKGGKMNLKHIIIGVIIIFILYIIYILRYETRWFIKSINVTLRNQNKVRNLQKKGSNRRNLTNNEIKKYIITAKKYLKKLNRENIKEFKIDEELERHLRYSKFSEKYVLELFNEILKHMKLEKEELKLKINYISSRNDLSYAGLYCESNAIKDIILNIRTNMNIDTIISVLAHESTHHLLLSNGIELEKRSENECLTDITTILLGFQKYMVEGYKMANTLQYVGTNTILVDKRAVGYITSKDIKYAGKVMKKVKQEYEVNYFKEKYHMVGKNDSKINEKI